MRAHEQQRPWDEEPFMKLMITVLGVAWLLSGCFFTNPPQEDSTGVGHKDPRTGLCNDATPPPCQPPRD
jgi:hypothetical protein